MSYINQDFNCLSPKKNQPGVQFTVTTTPKSKTSCQSSKSPGRIKKFQRRDCTPDSPETIGINWNETKTGGNRSIYENQFFQEKQKKNKFMELLENVIYEDKNEEKDEKSLYKNLFGEYNQEQENSDPNEVYKKEIIRTLDELNNKNFDLFEKIETRFMLINNELKTYETTLDRFKTHFLKLEYTLNDINSNENYFAVKGKIYMDNSFIGRPNTVKNSKFVSVYRSRFLIKRNKSSTGFFKRSVETYSLAEVEIFI